MPHKDIDRKREYFREYRERHRVELSKKAKVWREQNRESLKAKKRAEYLEHRATYIAKSKEWREANPERWKQLYKEWWDEHPLKNREYKLRHKWGLSVEAWELMLAHQDHLCPICLTDLTDTRQVDVDHCHKTGKIRGLLCTRCNRGLGQLQDDVQVLRRAVAYLEAHATDEVAATVPPDA